ncbi:hypothetical protein [Flagellimonas pacifica]|uniref:hypothetical protein n=1 Tax=Flagellimonas pacifica TaxID=1247520 RepID=UPI0013FD1A3E|nr:hypothetical protein [Allomuricauda parva]
MSILEILNVTDAFLGSTVASLLLKALFTFPSNFLALYFIALKLEDCTGRLSSFLLHAVNTTDTIMMIDINFDALFIN